MELTRSNQSLAAVTALSLVLAAVPARAQNPAQQADPVAAPTPIELKDPVAVVNGRNISSAELRQAINQRLARSGRSIDDLPPKMQLVGYHQALDDLIVDDLLGEKAKDIEIDEKTVEENLSRFRAQFDSEEAMIEAIQRNGETLDDLKAAIRDNLRKRKWIGDRITEDVAISDEEAQAFYEENKSSFAQPPMVRASHILLTTPEDLSEEEVAEKKRAIEQLKKRIDEGEDFAVLAKEFSEDPGSKDKGGDLDFFTKDRMVPEFAEAAFAAETGSVTDPVKTQFGWHIIHVTDRKEAREVPFEEAKEQIVGFLSSRTQQQEIEQLLTALRQQSDVKVNLPPMPETPSP